MVLESQVRDLNPPQLSVRHVRQAVQKQAMCSFSAEAETSLKKGVCEGA